MKPERIQNDLAAVNDWQPIAAGVVKTVPCETFEKASHLARHVELLARDLGVESYTLAIDEAHRLTVKVYAAAAEAAMGKPETGLVAKIKTAFGNFFARPMVA